MELKRCPHSDIPEVSEDEESRTNGEIPEERPPPTLTDVKSKREAFKRLRTVKSEV